MESLYTRCLWLQRRHNLRLPKVRIISQNDAGTWIFVVKFNPSSLCISNLSLKASWITAHEAVLWGRFVYQRSVTY